MKLVGCPVFDFAKAHGYLDLMTAMCNPDFAGIARMNGVLVRPHTVAMGFPDCDYRFVGDGSDLARSRPLLKNAGDYLYNGPLTSEYYRKGKAV